MTGLFYYICNVPKFGQHDNLQKKHLLRDLDAGLRFIFIIIGKCTRHRGIPLQAWRHGQDLSPLYSR